MQPQVGYLYLILYYRLQENMVHTGIILKNFYPPRLNLCLLDEHYGKIMVAIKEKQRFLRHGMGIEYQIDAQAATFKLEQIELISEPSAFAQQDLYFLHQLLELCYQLLPLHAPLHHFFFFIKEILQQHTYLHNIATKQLLLFKFFGLLDIYPEPLPFDFRSFKNLLETPLDELTRIVLSSEQRKNLGTWLTTCIASYPQSKHLKIEYISTCYGTI